MSDNMLVIPGMEEIMEDENAPKEFEFGKPKNLKRRYFDASKLPDAPGYQNVAENAKTYIVYITFPDFQTFKRGVKALRMGVGHSPTEINHTATIDAVFPRRKDNMTHLELWENLLLKESEE